MHKQDFDCKGGSMKGMKVGQDMTSGFEQPEDRQGWRHGGDVGPHFKGLLCHVNDFEPHYSHGQWGAIGIQAWGVRSSNLGFKVV